MPATATEHPDTQELAPSNRKFPKWFWAVIAGLTITELLFYAVLNLGALSLFPWARTIASIAGTLFGVLIMAKLLQYTYHKTRSVLDIPPSTELLSENMWWVVITISIVMSPIGFSFAPSPPYLVSGFAIVYIVAVPLAALGHRVIT